MKETQAAAALAQATEEGKEKGKRPDSTELKRSASTESKKSENGGKFSESKSQYFNDPIFAHYG